MKLLRVLFLILALANFGYSADPKSPADKKAEIERIKKIFDSLNFRTGVVPIIGGKAELLLQDKFEYLDQSDARKVLVDIFNNPPEIGSSQSGIIVPRGWGRDTDLDEWCAVLQWRDDGYIKDSEYDILNFDDMLSKMKEATKQESEDRVRRGYPPMLLHAWAQPPHYDKTTHKLYYAKTFDVGTAGTQQLNYDIKVLGRAGVLEVSIISSMEDLTRIQGLTPSILGAINFTQNNRYTDYQSGDKVAAYGIGGLIGVGLLAKAGFFKVIFTALAAAGKYIVIGIVAIGSWLAKLFGRRKQQ